MFDCKVFNVLLWKNFKLQCYRKSSIITVVALPLVFPFLIYLFLGNDDERKETRIVAFESYDIHDIAIGIM